MCQALIGLLLSVCVKCVTSRKGKPFSSEAADRGK